MDGGTASMKAKKPVMSVLGMEVEGRMGRGWYTGFRKRHPRLSRRTTQAQNVKKLKEWTPENAKLWISVLQGLQDDGYLDDPRGILNFDESGFKLAVMISKTIAPRGKQFVQSLTTGSCLSVVSTLIRLSEWLKIP